MTSYKELRTVLLNSYNIEKHKSIKKFIIYTDKQHKSLIKCKKENLDYQQINSKIDQLLQRDINLDPK